MTFWEGVMRFFAAMMVAIALAMAHPATAEQWPTRVVHLVVPYPAGGNVDTAARIVADKLQAKLGQPFIIDNKGGGWRR